ncbi:MAG: ATP-binding cassette domain-containing protein, partial [Chitinivibrionales bacterium]|nr:ATP-binding cassette domain-containing protein [Chitinivibrionales bacterium]
MIAFDSVTVRAGATTLLHDITFSMEKGEKVVIGGPTGSGKSTILMTLLGAHVPAKGTIRFNGIPLSPATVGTIRKQVAYIAQEPVLGTGLVREGLLLPFSFKANRHRQPSVDQINATLSRLLLPPAILDRDIALISGGEKQRIAIARALL